jgi:hypothetical protein
VEYLAHVANVSDWIAPFIAPLERLTAGGWHRLHVKAEGAGVGREVRLRVREWIATRDERSFWTGLKDHQTDSVVFLNDPKTKQGSVNQAQIQARQNRVR